MKRLALLFILLASPAFSEVKPARIFSNHMVLQRESPVAIFGTAAALEKVTVSFADQKVTTRADSGGNWLVFLKPMASNAKGQRLTINNIEIEDVLVGDIWLSSGQSNMRWTVSQSTNGASAIDEGEHQNIRLLDFIGTVYPSRKIFPIEQLKELTAENYFRTEGWQPATPATIGSFSAVAYYFGRRLSKEVGVPIGLIHTAVGGTMMENYISRESLQATDGLSNVLENWLESEKVPAWCRGRAAYNLQAWLLEYPHAPLPHHPFEPGFLFDAGIRHLAPFALKGVLWYQGESNAPIEISENPYTGGYDLEYSQLKFKTLIRDWRRHWQKEDLPFYFVQLPGLNRPWAFFREMQLETHLEIPSTGMVVTYDWGSPKNVHPADKQPVGERLALWALAKNYGKDVVYSGPVYKSCREKGNKLELSFTLCRGASLSSLDNRELLGFEIAGEDNRYFPATAEIVGEKVLLSSPEVIFPKRARYAWINDPKGKANFGTRSGLPASPFRTHKW